MLYDPEGPHPISQCRDANVLHPLLAPGGGSQGVLRKQIGINLLGTFA